MTQRTFRIISLVVVASLVMVAAVQCVWVARLYNDKKADFLRRVQSATYKSVYSHSVWMPSQGFSLPIW